PPEPAAPSRVRIRLLGSVLAIGLAAGAVLAAEKLNTTFHTLDDLRASVTVPTLAMVPLILSPSDRWRQRRKLALTAVSALIGLVLFVAGSYYVARGNEQIVRLMERGRL